METLFFQKIDPRAKTPVRAHEDDAGLDICALEGGTIRPGECVKVGTGLAMGLESGWMCLVLPRSGLASKYSITLANAPGLIDAGYRGEVCVLLINHGQADWSWKAGERIAQLMPMQFPNVVAKVVDSLEKTQRGTGGFGSTGVH